MATPKTFNLRFYECEHGGDLNRYIEDLRQCGSTVKDSKLDADAEEAVVRVEVPDFNSFRTAWEQTESSDYADSLGWLEESNA
jgi:hypothetical protein